MKRYLRSMISILLAASMLAGCAASKTGDDRAADDAGGQTQTPPTVGSELSEDAAEPEEERIPSDLPDMDLDGFTLTMLQGYYKERGAWREELTGENVNDAIYNRNILIQDRYNCKLEEVDCGTAHPSDNAVPQYVTSGDDTADVVFDGGEAIGNQIKYYRNMNKLAYFRFDMPWWNKEFNEGVTLSGKLFFTIGAYMTSAKSAIYHVIFNKTIAENYGIGGNSMYELVREDRWTLDRMTEYARLVKSDLNGDGEYDTNDLWGLFGENYSTWTLALGAGFRCAEIGEDGLPEITFNSEINNNILDKVLQLAGNRETTLFAQRITGVADVWEAHSMLLHKDGRWLFVVGGLGGQRDMEDDYGVLPSPKYDENQSRYYHDASLHNSPTTGIPISATDADISSLLLEAMSYESFYSVLPVFYDNYLHTKLVRDEDSVEMLRIIHNSLFYDVGALYNWGKMREIIEDMGKSTTNNLATRYASVSRGIPKQMARLFKEIESHD